VSELSDLFARSDAVSIHAPLTDQTRGAVAAEDLAALGERGVLINTSRGPIVDERALLGALETGKLGGAGLDTFETEPPDGDNPLFDRDDVVLTPHVGGVTYDALTRMSQRAAANVRTVYEGDLPQSTVNRGAVGGEK
jgi:phosphoglycerate dehydrogenase-like enzyme